MASATPQKVAMCFRGHDKSRLMGVVIAAPYTTYLEDHPILYVGLFPFQMA